MRDEEPDTTEEAALRAQVRGLVAEGRTADALDVVIARLASLERRNGELLRAAGVDRPAPVPPRDEDALLLPPAIAALEGVVRRGRSLLTRLPRVTIEPDGACRCPRCGAAEGTPAPRELLELSDASRLHVEVHPAVACDRCGAAPRRGVRPGPRLLAHLVVAAYGDRVPFAQQAISLRRSGASITPAAMQAWTGAVADALAPIAAEIARRASVTEVGRPPSRVLAGAPLDARAVTIATVLRACEGAAVAPVDYLAGVLRALEAGVPASKVGELVPVRA